MVSCGPMGLALDRLEDLPGLERVVAFSTSSVLGKAASADPAERDLMRNIAAQEAQLKEGCANRGVVLLLLRPTLIWGCGLDRNVSLLARFGRRFGFIPVAGEAAGLRQPVHADDLAELAVRALATDFGPCLESAACGASTLSYRDLAGRIAAAGQRKIRVVAMPPAALAGLIRLASLLPAFRGVNAEMVHRQGRDLVFDDSILREALEYAPRGFHPEAGDFAIPPRAERFRLPGS
jgi:nucleoside-diphosphate-sugar epimerase